MAIFQIVGIEFDEIDRLKMAVSASSATGPRCFRWAYAMLSGPLALDEPAFLIAPLTMFVFY